MDIGIYFIAGLVVGIAMGMIIGKLRWGKRP